MPVGCKIPKKHRQLTKEISVLQNFKHKDHGDLEIIGLRFLE